MTKEEAWKAWESNYWLVLYKIIPEQGATIKAYIEANRDKLKTVMVKIYYSSENSLKPMLQIPPTYNTYYYYRGNFYRQLPARNQEETTPSVDMLVGEELQKLWQNQDFVKSLVGMDLSTGAYHP